MECEPGNNYGFFKMSAYYWNRCRLGFVCFGLILAAGCASQTEQLSETGNFPESGGAGLANFPGKLIEGSKQGLEQLSETPGLLLESTRDSFEDWPNRIIEDTKQSLLRADNLTTLLLAGGATIAMHSSGADKNLAENFDRHSIFNGFIDESLNVTGHPGTHLVAASLWYGLSSRNQDEFNKQRAWTMMTALSVTTLTTTALKLTRQNESPNGKDWAWPSAHTASSFAVASVLDEFYGPKVGIPGYALASLVAYRMMDTGDHWPSDVVFGATLGWVVGHTFAGRHKELEIAGFKVSPCVASSNGPVIGISLFKQF